MKLVCPTAGCRGTQEDIRFLEHVEIEHKILGVHADGTVVVDTQEERNETEGDCFGFCCGRCGAAWAAEDTPGFKVFDFDPDHRE